MGLENTHHRVCRWREGEVWEILHEILISEQDFKRLMIDASPITVHRHAAEAHGGNQAMGRAKRGPDSWIHLAVNAHGMLVRMFITAGLIVDYSQAYWLIEGIDAEHLLADWGYGSDALVDSVQQARINPAISLCKNR